MSKADVGGLSSTLPPSQWLSPPREECKLGEGGLERFSVKEEWENSACGQHLRKELGEGHREGASGLRACG